MALIISTVVGLVVLFVPTLIYLRYTDRRIFRKRLARRDLLEKAKPWREASPGEVARLDGVVEAVTTPTMAPLSGKQAVWHRLRGFHVHGDSRSAPIVDVETKGRFVIRGVDGVALVHFAGETPGPGPDLLSSGEEDDAESRISIHVETGTVMSVSAPLEAFLAERSSTLVERDGFQRQYEFEENLVEVGAPMMLLAEKPHAAAVPADSPFRLGDGPAPPEAIPLVLAPSAESLVIRDRSTTLYAKGGFFLMIVVGPAITIACILYAVLSPE